MARLCVAVTALVLVAGCKTHRHRDTPLVKLVLRKMTTALKAYAIETGAFPIGRSAALPRPNPPDAAAKGCCGSTSTGTTVDHKCPVSKELASDPIWSKLDVSVDEPSWHRFTYESVDGKSFIITAEGDLDCDGDIATYTVSGFLDAQGSPTSTLTPPPNGEY
jgi:hypothetical protein